MIDSRRPRGDTVPTTILSDGPETRGRALVLGAGGNTGIAWEAGVLDGLADGGVDPADSDLIVGTSAGAIVGAYLALGHSPRDLATHLLDRSRTRARPTFRGVAALGIAQVARDRERAIQALAQRTRDWSLLTEATWLDAVSSGLFGRPWPPHLRVTAVNGRTGRAIVLDASSGVDLGVAVAASCSVPGIFPPVMIDRDPFLDGGLRSPANVDVADGYGRVLALTPFTRSRDPRRRPSEQLRCLGVQVAWAHLWPDRSALRAMGVDPLSSDNNHAARDAGRRQAAHALPAVRRVWSAGRQGQRAASDATARDARTASASA